MNTISPITAEKARKTHQEADALIRRAYEGRVGWSALQTAYQQKMRCAYATVKDDPQAGAAWAASTRPSRPSESASLY